MINSREVPRSLPSSFQTLCRLKLPVFCNLIQRKRKKRFKWEKNERKVAWKITSNCQANLIGKRLINFTSSHGGELNILTRHVISEEQLLFVLMQIIVEVTFIYLENRIKKFLLLEIRIVFAEVSMLVDPVA